MPSRAGSATAPGNSGAGGCRLPRVQRSRTKLRGEHFMPRCLEPKLDVLPAAQKEIWTNLAPASHLNFVLYGGTATPLPLTHRETLAFALFPSNLLATESIHAII